MAKLEINVMAGGRPVKGAVITVYDENPAVDIGAESGQFGESDKTTIYDDWQETTQASNPGTTDSFGSFKCYAPNLTQVAVQIYRAGYGTQWRRFIDIVGTDPL